MEPEEVPIHVDEEEEEDERMDESRDPELEESGYTIDESEEEEVDASVAEDMEAFEKSFKGISQKYRLINRIGEGTFSTVYKAEDLLYDHYTNDWDVEEKENKKWSPAPNKRHTQQKRKPRYVAIKKIYVTSSPVRIFNELELLHDLRNQDSVCPLITAFRDQDQVIAILPYFQHRDFREYFRDFTVKDMRYYFRSLFTALKAVHERGILHRDIKPTNFLYDPRHARGVLVDFGLAEREGQDWHACPCASTPDEREWKIEHSVWANTMRARTSTSHIEPTFPKSDQRPSRRANRAGTRGFRAPEVLFKCTAQTTAIDIWSAGVILLTLLSRRFPFFHSADDIDALLELTNIFGRDVMRETALLHGQVFETNIPSYSDKGHSFEKIVLWCTGRSGADEMGRKTKPSPEEKDAIRFLERLLTCDPTVRYTAEEALEDPFIANADEGNEDGDEMVDLVNST
ncbi:protein kinase [Saccharata proteae CBS 121410]|uniref:non-specific serine/threonine protein kinase n=1 Tax=Saccharata proteae CBS 121410 TaxID=1314787 RepID=A0A9P4LWF7_9PEZI|nr:protein kinase [Saccharata proteae CBS 121410]